MKVGIYYFRSLYSQSACSLSSGKASNCFLKNGYETNIGLLSQKNYEVNLEHINDMLNNDIIIYKANFKDFEYGIRFFKSFLESVDKKRFFLAGPFSLLNSKLIKKEFSFVEDILDFNNLLKLSEIFPKISDPVFKQSVICNVDRQIEILEKGSYINLEAGSGCFNKCNFCHINILHYPFVSYPIKEVVDEVENLNKKLKKQYFIFNDSVFYKGVNDEKRILDFCNEVKKRNLHFYFYIYLTLAPMIPKKLLEKLKEVGLIRIFFGIESVTDDFQINNYKKVSSISSDVFINLLKKEKISYHIGYILFYPDVTYSNLFVNLEYLYKIKKLFRIGILVEKMRIIPNSPNDNILFHNDIKIDQAYNYYFFDKRVEQCFFNINRLFKNIDIRNFEQFFTGIDIAKIILNREHKEKLYLFELKKYYDILNLVNNSIYTICYEIFKNLKITDEMVTKLLEIYSQAENNYLLFMNKLKENDPEIFNMIPHGKEELNII